MSVLVRVAQRLVRGITLGIVGAMCGCGPSGEGAAGGYHTSGTLTISVRAVVAQSNQAPLPFPSLALCGSPAHEVRRVLRQAERDYEYEQRALREKLDRLEAQQSETESRLDLERAELAREYNVKTPRSDAPEYQSRDPLDGVSKARAAKSRLAEWYAQAFRSRIAPLEDDLKQVQEGIKAVQSDIVNLRSSFNDRLFAALPATPAKQWKTEADGRAAITVARNEPWFVWAQANRTMATTRETEGHIDPTTGRVRMTQRDGGFVRSTFRWLALVPDQLDPSGQLVLDQSNLFDGRALTAALRDGGGDAAILSPVRQ